MGEELGEEMAKNWGKFSGHFRASFALQNDQSKFLPKFLRSYHSVSCG